MSKSNQLRLPLTLDPELPPWELRGRTQKFWYYVYMPKFDTMLCMLDDGEWDWRPADTIRDTPHLFNTKNEATRIAKKFRYATVRLYKWEKTTDIKVG